MKLAITGMAGRLPAATEKTLPERNATVARNCDLRRGMIEAIHGPGTTGVTVTSGTKTIHRWWDGTSAYWMRFSEHTDVVPGPVADDVWERVYWADGINAPRMSYTGKIQGGTPPNISYLMGVPPPTNIISVEASSADYSRTFLAASSSFWSMQNPIVYEGGAGNNHGLSTGDTVVFTGVASESEIGGKADLHSILNGNPVQVTVLSNTSFSIPYNGEFYNQLIMSIGGTLSQYVDPTRVVTRFYTHTFVSEIGEEGPPHTPVAVQVGQNQSVEITIPSPDSQDTTSRNLTHVRIYRTVTGSSGSEFYFITQQAIGAGSYTDTSTDESLPDQGALQSSQWDPPHTDTAGMDVAAQGFLVGWYDNVLAFSEPYRPWAWPTSYGLALDYEIVAARTIDNGVVVGTTGRPYIVQGTNPRSMMAKRLDVDYACVSARSMVSMGWGAMFASDDGLVWVTRGGAKLITESIITPQQWQDYQPETIHAYQWGTVYLAFYGTTVHNGKGFYFDPAHPENGIVDLDEWYISGFREPRDEALYVLDGTTIKKWNDIDADKIPYTWRSKLFWSPRPINLAAAKVFARSYTDVLAALYVDGSETPADETVPADDEAFRLPSRLYRMFNIEVTGTDSVEIIEAAESSMELEQ